MKGAEFIKNILFPKECLQCQKDNYWLCPECLQILKQNIDLKKDTTYYNIDSVFILSKYENNEIIKKSIHALKYRFIKDMAEILGDIAYQKIKQELTSKLLLAPVPLSKYRRRWRGFNQSEQIAQTISKKSNLPITKGLIRKKHRPQQAKLNKEKRETNVCGCFAWKKEYSINDQILLIDDVLTTGSTLQECAKILKKAGAKNIKALVLAQG